jgi:hypothetical protein
MSILYYVFINDAFLIKHHKKHNKESKMTHKRNEAIETIEAPVLDTQDNNTDTQFMSEPDFEMDSFELSLEELDTVTAHTMSAKAENTSTSKKKSEAWVKAKECWVEWFSDEAESIRKRYKSMHKAFKNHKIDSMKLTIGNYRVTFVVDHKNARSIERVLREFTFKNTIDGKDYHCTFENAVAIHEPLVQHAGRPAKNPITKPEYFLIQPIV